MDPQLAAKAQLTLPGWHPGGDLMPLEEEMRAAAAAGELADRAVGPCNLAEMRAWGAKRAIRATVLRYLLTGDKWPVDAKGVRLRGVRIVGPLDLDAATLRCPLSLDCCYLDANEPLCLDHATVPRLRLIRCQLTGLNGGRLLAGQIDLSGSTLTGPLLVPSADITGQLVCRGAQLTGQDRDGDALVADAIKVGGPVLLEGMVASAGAVRLLGAAISGQLNCTGAQLTGRYSGGNALLADGMKVGGSVFLNRMSVSDGAVRLPNADISGQLNCQGAKLNGQDREGYALVCFGMKVRGHVLLDGDFAAAGAVRLSNADISGQLNCRGAQLTGQDGEGNALIADAMRVRGPVLMEGASTSHGAVRLSGADISGPLVCRGVRLTGHDSLGSALIADGIKVGSNLFLDGGVIAAGTIVLHSARIGGSVELSPEALAHEDHVALDAAEAQITGQLLWAPTRQVSGQVNLEDVTVGHLEDHWSNERPNGFWPTEGQLRLDGFSYGRFGGTQQATVEQRLEWIHSQYRPKPTVRWKNRIMARPVITAPPVRTAAEDGRGFVPGPYEQLAKVYRQVGKDDEARKVAIARRRDLRTYGNLNLYRRFGNWFLDMTIRYGYHTWRAGMALAVLFLIFWGLSALAQQHHLIAWAGDISGLHFVPSATECASSYPCFYPFGYTVNTVIPLINVHQGDFWGPDRAPRGEWHFKSPPG